MQARLGPDRRQRAQCQHPMMDQRASNRPSATPMPPPSGNLGTTVIEAASDRADGGHGLCLSIVVISYNIPRELPRTLFSLSGAYQRGVSSQDYEVILVDNGSPVPPDPADYAGLDLQLRLLSCPNPQTTPVFAINLGLAAARGAHIALMIDGARLASPGLLRSALEALRLSPRAVVGSRGRYLGPGHQSFTMRYGYGQRLEDWLLKRSHWQADGYRLFRLSVFDESSGVSWFDQITESNALFMARPLWQELRGCDEAFRLKGGGLVNLDLWIRACALPEACPILLLGEATFHQFHGGTSTNNRDQHNYWLAAAGEYQRIRGIPWIRPSLPLKFWGQFQHQPPRRELCGGRWRRRPGRVTGA